MIYTVAELTTTLDERAGDDRPIFWSDDPQGGRDAARQVEVEIEQWPDPETGELEEVVVLYPV